MGENATVPKETPEELAERERQRRAIEAAATSRNQPEEGVIWAAIKSFFKWFFELFCNQ